jgi:uncharacterized protein YlaN (UPF0358 family)
VSTKEKVLPNLIQESNEVITKLDKLDAQVIRSNVNTTLQNYTIPQIKVIIKERIDEVIFNLLKKNKSKLVKLLFLNFS